MLSPPSCVSPPLNLHNRLVEDCGIGKEEVLLEAAVEMKTETEELKDLLVGDVCKKTYEELGEGVSAARIFWGGANDGTTFE
jgi:hypothetical protein